MFNTISIVSSILGVFVFFIIIMGGSVIASRGGMGIHTYSPILGLRKFKIDESPSANIIIDIVGRQKGFLQWFLTKIGINPEISFRLTNHAVIFIKSNLFGESNITVPLKSICSTHCGYSKPVGLIFLGIFLMLSGIVLWIALGIVGSHGFGILIFILGIIIGVIFINSYRLSKTIYISIGTNGGLYLGVAFQRTIIENISVDFNQAMKVSKIISMKIAGGQPDDFVYKGSEIKEKICSKCGEKNTVDSIFCEKCGMSLS